MGQKEARMFSHERDDDYWYMIKNKWYQIRLTVEQRKKAVLASNQYEAAWLVHKNVNKQKNVTYYRNPGL